MSLTPGRAAPLTLVLLSALSATLAAGSRCQAQSARQFAAARNWMVEADIATAGVKHPAVLAAMRTVPRHEFVPAELRPYAYRDITLPIGEKQTISSPYIVAWMTEQLDPQPTDRVLEIGTGSGYQAAVLSRLVKDVYTIEIQEPLAAHAKEVIESLSFKNVHFRSGDGFQGWPEAAPFDKIIVTCSPEKVPAPLAKQLREGGRMLIPVGERFQQDLCTLVKREGTLEVESREPTYFVPMTGSAESLRSVRPDGPLTPLANGDFEQLLEPDKPANWYYVRRATIERGGPTNESGHFITFESQAAEAQSHALQSFGVDGASVSELHIDVWVKADDVQGAGSPHDGGRLVISFFDEQRNWLGEQTVGWWRGSFHWRRQSGRALVPREAKIATLGLGLFDATGRLSCDDVKVRQGQLRTAAQAR